ncbi:MAG: hypothetical protein U0469_02740 [Candidatus Paceibacterota bacterium]|jgi:hypothetical protein
MAYIPTIHTFEDDVNENRNFDEAPITGGVEKIVGTNSILVSENTDGGSSITKKILTLVSILFVLGSVSAVGYYFYTNYKAKQAQDLINKQAEEMKKLADQSSYDKNSINQLFPNLAIGIAPYIKTSTQNNNLIILTIKPNDPSTGIDNYSQLYAYILSHQKDLGRDLVQTFNLEQIAADNIDLNAVISTSSDNNLNSSTSININSTSSSLEQVVNFFDPTNLQKQINSALNSFAPQAPISGDKLVWESKTLNNQDFQIANAGVVTLIYGYAKNNNYVIFATSLKDFFDAIDSLQ